MPLFRQMYSFQLVNTNLFFPTRKLNSVVMFLNADVMWWVQNFCMRFSGFFCIRHPFLSKCLLPMRKRRKSNFFYDGRKFWRQCLDVIDTTWGRIYFLTCENFELSVQWPLAKCQKKLKIYFSFDTNALCSAERIAFQSILHFIACFYLFHSILKNIKLKVQILPNMYICSGFVILRVLLA